VGSGSLIFWGEARRRQLSAEQGGCEACQVRVQSSWVADSRGRDPCFYSVHSRISRDQQFGIRAGTWNHSGDA
jgi:hypothetical protein